jgi:DMSO/TMAO reductase YedYZ heme-binding membrane subunit
MGGRRWTQLHRKAYWAEGLVFIHMILQFGRPQILALSFFIPLWILQYLRKKI